MTEGWVQRGEEITVATPGWGPIRGIDQSSVDAIPYDRTITSCSDVITITAINCACVSIEKKGLKAAALVGSKGMLGLGKGVAAMLRRAQLPVPDGYFDGHNGINWRGLSWEAERARMRQDEHGEWHYINTPPREEEFVERSVNVFLCEEIKDDALLILPDGPLIEIRDFSDVDWGKSQVWRVLLRPEPNQ
jgi:hypothetical protein